jgi:hypothetical protein
VLSEELIEGQSGVEAKLAEAGADQVRRHSFDEAPEIAAPEEGTPAERARNERGQFAAQESDIQEPEASEPEAEVAVDQQGNPDIEKFLAKYNGDVDKALEGAVNLQRQMGQQTNELGELRQLVTELGTLNQNISAAQTAAQNQPQHLDQGTVDWFDQQAYENPNQMVDWARQQNNPILFQRGMEVWKEQDPYGASVYTNELRNQQFHSEIQQQIQKQQQLPQDAAMNLALQGVLARTPEYSTFSDVLGATFEKRPWLQAQLNQAAATGNPAEMESVIEAAYDLARGDTLFSALRAGDTPADSSTTADVAVPATSEERQEPVEKSNLDTFREQFRQEAERRTRGAWTAH